jgi:hypothetical protein
MKRVIARLDIKGNRLVKGIHLEGWRFLPNHPNDYCFDYYRQRTECVHTSADYMPYMPNISHCIKSG